MKSYFTIPKSLNIEVLIAKERTNISFYSIATFCDLLARKIIYDNKKNYKTNGYLKLYSPIIKKIIPQYKECIRLLVSNGIIETDEHYIVSVESKGYRFKKEILKDGFQRIEKELNYQDGKRYRRKLRIKNNQGNLLKRREFLLKPFRDARISIDKKEALKMLTNLYGAEINYAQLKLERARTDKNKQKWESVLKNLNLAISCQKIIVEIINSDDVINHISIDETGQRLHSPITHLKTELRPFLRIDGKPVVSKLI